MRPVPEWASVYDDPKLARRGYVFRRGLELASEACLRHASRGDLWLDAGCGPGHLATRLAGAGLRVIGVDLDAASVYGARDRSREPPGRALHLLCADACAVPLAGGSVDGVVATSLAGCLPDVAAFLREAARVLKPGGWLVMTFTNRASLLLRLNAAAARAERWLTGAPGDPVRYRLYSAGQIDGLLVEAGFQRDRLCHYSYVLNLGPSLWPPPALARRLDRDARRGSRLARNGLVVATRR
jgi:SAM-dependent methyltransferase